MSDNGATTNNIIYRQDYRPPAYSVVHVELHVDIQDDHCQVSSTLEIQRQSGVDVESPLLLQGRAQELLSVSIDGRQLQAGEYLVSEQELRLEKVPERFRLEIASRHDPYANTSLDGFYRSGDILCTQCEAHGFSRISYFPDRPDVLASYRVSIEADRQRYPVLLANGNRVAAEQLPNGRHRVIWEDPHPKPCYLFAMVAGDLACVTDSYQTASGRDVAIHFYVEHGDEKRCDQAIHSLKAAMAWDERTYGLEYDLDLYMVVAVGSFNMGAMENKGLNIFNSKYVLADSDTATDTDYELIQAVIGHEYFHNWTGNRVTCRDWFQLSLKEGLTVFREQQFMADSLASSTQRLEQVRLLRSQQFAEDAGPMAHPVRPESYIEVNNFYTLTVYEKGAEIIRMLNNLLGQDVFREGLRLYLQRHDGTAATIDDFLAAMASASRRDLSSFQHWYSQAGTPRLKAVETHDEEQGIYSLTLTQQTPPTPDQPVKQAVPVPVRMALIDARGGRLTLANGGQETTLLLEQESQTFEFSGIPARPVPVLLRSFSAPVKLEYLYRRDQLALIARYEEDGFSRWDAMQRLYQDLIDTGIGGDQPDIMPVVKLFRDLLSDAVADPALTAELLRLPSESLLAEAYDPVPVDALIQVRDHLESSLAAALSADICDQYQQLATNQPYIFDGLAVGRRRLKNLCLYYWALAEEAGRQAAVEQYTNADNMTDRLGALEALNHIDCEQRRTIMQDFASRWSQQVLVMDKWRSLQAVSRLPDALGRIRALRDAEGFDANNPNRIRSLLGAFCSANLRAFHAPDGEAYRWLAEEILRLDNVNPQVAARLVTPLCHWRRQQNGRAGLMQSALRNIADKKSLSRDVYEIVTKALETPS